MLTANRLHELLSYDPETGEFRWRTRRKGVAAGSIAGTMNGRGYLQITIDRRINLAHRLAWLHATGEWPDDQIDHVNRVKTDNRLANLREATRSQNNANKGVRRDSNSGFKGVHKNKQTGRWRAEIMVNGHYQYLGTFDDPAEAHDAYCKAAKAFGDFHPIAGVEPCPSTIPSTQKDKAA